MELQEIDSDKEFSAETPSLKSMNPGKRSKGYFDLDQGDKPELGQKTRYYFKSNFKDIMRHKCHFCISTCSIFIVVLMALVVYSVIDKAPIIFLRLAEKNSGEIDAIIAPPLRKSTAYGSKHETMECFNYTRFHELLPNRNFSPRHQMDAQVVNEGKGNDFTNPETALFIDTELERKNGLGRNYPFPKLAKDECVLSKELMRNKGVGVNDTVTVYLDISYLNNQARFNERYFSQDDDTSNLSIYGEIHIDCKIIGQLNETLGKIDDGEKDKLVILEYEYIFDHISGYLANNKILPGGFLSETPSEEILQKFKLFFKEEDPYEYAGHIIMMFNDPRLDYYKSPDYNKLLADSLSELTDVQEKLGYYPVEMHLPLLGQLQQFNLAILFMGLLFSMILSLFVVISVILIYGLLLVNVQQKTFEIGIKRMLGESRIGLVKDVLFQTFFFSTPGIILAFGASFIVLRLVYYYEFELRLGLKLDPNPTIMAVWNAFVLGIIIPIISSLVPIKTALHKNLNDALDYEHSQTKSVVIQIQSENSNNISVTLIFGIISTIYGVTIYIFLPQCMLSLDFGNLLGIFFLILIGLLLGLILVTMNLQFIIEIVITKVLFWWEKKYIRMLILKNLVAHRLRNSSTSLVYALSLSFLILCVVSYSLQLQNVELIKIKIFNEVRVSKRSGLEIYELEEFLKKKEDIVEAFGYKMHKLAPWFVKETYTTAHSRFITKPVQVIGVTPYLFDTFNPDYVEAGYEDGSALPYSEQLYSLKGAHAAGIGSHLANLLHVFPEMENEHSNFLLNLRYDETGPTVYYNTETKFTIDAVLGIRMGKRQLTREIDIIMSVPNIYHLLNFEESRYRMPRFKHCYIKFKPGLDQKVRDGFLSGLRGHGWVESIDENKEQISEVKHILDVIFDIIIALSMFLCLFSLVSSTSANMMEQTKEIGVLRAIGFTRFMIKRLYFYETFVLVFASSCLGIIVGTFVGWTMTVQQAEFISIPVTFYFPYSHLIATGFVSLLCSFVAVYSPTSFILKHQVAEIFRIN